MSPHTPGPWSVVDDPQSDYVDIVAKYGYGAVCRVERSEVGLYNARLIAAAPDLLAALNAAVAALNEYVWRVTPQPDAQQEAQRTMAQGPDVCQMARLAMRKAQVAVSRVSQCE